MQPRLKIPPFLTEKQKAAIRRMLPKYRKAKRENENCLVYFRLDTEYYIMFGADVERMTKGQFNYMGSISDFEWLRAGLTESGHSVVVIEERKTP